MATYKLVDEEKLDAAMTATADAIRAKTGGTDPIAWDAEKGMSEAVEPVFEAGKKAEYDAFWDALQNNGQRRVYGQDFQSPLWTDATFRPKYDVFPRENTFSDGLGTPVNHCNITDMRKCTLGVNIDWSLNDNFNYILRGVPIRYIGTIDMTNAVHGWTLLYSSTAETVEKVILPPEGAKIYFRTHGFAGMVNLIEIRFDGHFFGDVEMKESTKLSKDSIKSVIAALSENTESAHVTLSLTAVNNAFETASGAADGSTSEEWITLIATKPNWTIALADA